MTEGGTAHQYFMETMHSAHELEAPTRAHPVATTAELLAALPH